MNESADFPRLDESAEHPAEDDPELVGLFVKQRTVAVCERLNGQRPLRSQMRRRPNTTQMLECYPVMAARGFATDELVLGLLRFEHRHQRCNRDERRHFLGVGLGVQQPKRAAPRVADQPDLLLAKAPTKMIDDDIQVGEVLIDGQFVRVGTRVVRTSSATLIPVAHNEALFELAIEVPEQRAFCSTRASVQPQQDGGAPIRSMRL
jgi:hypothetical protein